MIGDVVGDPGLEVLENRLPHLKNEFSADFITVNGENAAGGFGLTEALLQRIFSAGADVVTSGNHIWEKREFWPVLDSEKRVLRPMNFPAETPGRGWVIIEKPSPLGPISWLTVNLQGREFMNPIDCPFKSFDHLEMNIQDSAKDKTPIGKSVILVDFHAESTKEKEALAYYLDGRVCVIAGTHSHVQTADERILPKGSAYISDLGMTGVMDGIIGMDRKICMDRARNQVLYRMEIAAPESNGKIAINGILVEIDVDNRKALSIKRFSA